MYKLLALDIDGTLLNSKGEISDSTVEAIKRAQNKKVMVTISTGRPIQGVYKYVDLLGLNAPIISYNGGMIVDVKKDEIIYEQLLDSKDAKQVIELGLKYDTTVIVWSKNRLYVSRMDEHIAIYQKMSGEVANLIEDYAALYAQGVSKVIWYSDPERLIEYQGEIKGVVNKTVTFVTSHPYYLEFFNEKVSKAKALEFIGQKYGIKREEMIAIGDGNNDIEMIDYVGMGVAMGNATEGVKSVANHITTSNDDHGIFNALEHLIK